MGIVSTLSDAGQTEQPIAGAIPCLLTHREFINSLLTEEASVHSKISNSIVNCLSNDVAITSSF